MNRAKFLTFAFSGLVGSVLATVLTSCANSGQVAGDANNVPFVAVIQAVGYPALDAVRSGIQDELAAAGYEPGTTLRWEWRNARGNPATARQIANKYVMADPDVIVAIADPSAQFAAAAAKNISIIFSALPDPVGTKLVANADRPGGNISGVSDRAPITEQLELIKEILPEATTLGIIHDANSDSSLDLISSMNQAARDQNLTIQVVSVQDASEVSAAAKSLVGLVDAIYLPADSAVSAALASAIQVGKDNQVPVFGEDRAAVEKGAIATISFDYYDMGRQTGDMVIKVLEGTRAGDLPVEFVRDLQLIINPAAALGMGIELPSAVVSQADETVE
ncbi:MAG: ABC transporter substrate-binding protein [Phormidesmis sp.]